MSLDVQARSHASRSTSRHLRRVARTSRCCGAGWTGWCAIIVITFASVVYFADTRMKTRDNSFSGFPGCWNMVVIVLFALQPNFWAILGIVVVLAAAMFMPLKFVHPVRTDRWRAVSLPVALAWVFFAGWAAWVDFDPQSWAHWGPAGLAAIPVPAGSRPRRPS